MERCFIQDQESTYIKFEKAASLKVPQYQAFYIRGSASGVANNRKIVLSLKLDSTDAFPALIYLICSSQILSKEFNENVNKSLCFCEILIYIASVNRLLPALLTTPCKREAQQPAELRQSETRQFRLSGRPPCIVPQDPYPCRRSCRSLSTTEFFPSPTVARIVGVVTPRSQTDTPQSQPPPTYTPLLPIPTGLTLWKVTRLSTTPTSSCAWAHSDTFFLNYA